VEQIRAPAGFPTDSSSWKVPREPTTSPNAYEASLPAGTCAGTRSLFPYSLSSPLGKMSRKVPVLMVLDANLQQMNIHLTGGAAVELCFVSVVALTVTQGQSPYLRHKCAAAQRMQTYSCPRITSTRMFSTIAGPFPVELDAINFPG
jgi:hypothetical protein